MNNVTDKKALQFIDEVTELALKLGVDFFVVTRGGMTMSNNLSNDVDVKHAQASYYEFHMKFKEMTFGDLITYFNTLPNSTPVMPFDNGKYTVTKMIKLCDNNKVSIHDVSDDAWRRCISFVWVDNIPSITIIGRDQIHHTFNNALPITEYDWSKSDYPSLKGFLMDLIGSNQC